MKRFLRPIHYITYLIALSLLYGLFTTITMKLEGGIKFKADRIINLAVLFIPFVFCQIILAALVFRNLSLKKLFFLSIIFIFASCIFSVIILPMLDNLGPVNILSVFWNLLELVFMLFFSLLVLAILQRRQLMTRLKQQVCDIQTASPDEPAVGSKYPQQTITKPQFKYHWWYWDIGLAVIPLWFVILLDPFGVINYMCGLINVPIHLFAAFCSLTLIPAGMICLIWFVVRMFIIWPRHFHPWHRLLLYWAIVIGAVAFFIGPFFIRIFPPPFEGYARGLRRHFEAKTDIEAIQRRLSILDSNNRQDQPMNVKIDPVVKIKDTPKTISESYAIKCLRPPHSNLEFDDTGRPMIRLMWGSGMLGSWGLVVGDKNMEIPETKRPEWEEIHFGNNTQKKLRHGEFRLPITSGAYVWYELD